MAFDDQSPATPASDESSQSHPLPSSLHRPQLSEGSASSPTAKTRSRPRTVDGVPRKISFAFPNPANPHTLADPATNRLVMSPQAIDRVFPVRSVVSLDSAATPMPQGDPHDESLGLSLPRSNDRGRDTLPRHSSSSSLATADRTPTPPRRTHTSSDLHGPQPQRPTASSPRARPRPSLDATTNTTIIRAPHQEINSLMADTTSMKSDGDSIADGHSIISQTQSITSVPETAQLPLTARFQHVVKDGNHAVVTGSDGSIPQTCEDEPIHIPGAIQSFGLLIALREEADNLLVRVVSENSTKLIGYTPQQLFQVESFTSILNEDQADNFLDHLDFIREEAGTDPAIHGPEIFLLSIKNAQRKKSLKFWCAIHISGPDKDLIICELELEDDLQNPLVAAADPTPEPPLDTLGSEPTPEEFAESTVNASKPLRVLRSARKKRSEAAAMEVFNIMGQIQGQLADAPTLPEFLKILIGVVKELTGFHRVMIYQFDQHFNGRVVSELVDPRATKDLYMGLNFPASDIPKQARELYRLNRVRLLYDRDQETARLVCRTAQDLAEPLDMTFAYLRAMSPIHLKYLANMAVRSSMSISINAFGELWGLIACHAYGQKGMRVSFPIRKMCRLIGDAASRNIERLSYAARLQARKLINTACTSENPSGYIVASSDDLLSLFSADFGALSIRDETRLLGKVDNNIQELLAILEFLRLRQIASVFASANVTTDFPDLCYSPGFHLIAGLLFVPLSSSGADFIVFFRKSSLKEVKWAGNPYEKSVKEGTEGYLEPRKSFKTWSETVAGTCREWTEEEIETSAVLCLVYGKFIDVWRQKEAALEHSQFQRLLLANSAHEVRTPLNAIINYLEIALEGNLDTDTRDNLTRSHSASKSLVYVINDLLDLTKIEQGLDLVKDETFDFNTMLQEATEPFQKDAQRKGLEYRITLRDEVPRRLCGDPRRLRQVISNLIANAIQNTTTGYVAIDVSKLVDQSDHGTVDIQFAVEDTGAGMPHEKVDALFRELEQVSSESQNVTSTMIAHDSESQHPATGSTEAILGLGLAVVARAVRNMKGQLRVRTEQSKGSLFVIKLTMSLPAPGDSDHSLTESHTNDQVAALPEHLTPVQVGPMDAPSRDERGQKERSWTMASSQAPSENSGSSLRSRNSLQSMRSGHNGQSATNDVDRLIGDIQKPHLLADPKKSEVQRRPLSVSKHVGWASSVGDEPSKTSAVNVDPATVGQAHEGVPGEEAVMSSRTPVKAVRIPDDEMVSPAGGFSIRLATGGSSQLQRGMPERGSDPCPGSTCLSVLVAEDDPINCKIMKKRLEKLGHQVHLTLNGQECFSALGERPCQYDVVLMDLQMPIVDGFTSTRMIRAFEKGHDMSSRSARVIANGRIPIFAVSASLLEADRAQYMEHGFDGWILKPVNFQRVDGLLKGIDNEETRNDCLYEPGQWEHGGWFEKRQKCRDNDSTVDTTPGARSAAIESLKCPTLPIKADTI